MPANKTKPTSASVPAYIASRATREQRKDARALMALLRKITKRRPVLWGSSLVGYGSYDYTYASGHGGTAPLAAFAIRGREIVVYLTVETPGQRALLAKLGKHRMTKSCLYFKRLEEVDVAVLERLVRGSIAEVRRRYG